MLFWITVVLFIISVAVAILHEDYFQSLGGFVTTIFLGIILISMFLVLLVNYIPAESEVEANRERYEALMFRLENEEIRDEFGLINNDILISVQHWNEDVRRYKKLQKDFWIGIFIPDVFDEFECIDYNRILTEGEIKNAQ